MLSPEAEMVGVTIESGVAEPVESMDLVESGRTWLYNDPEMKKEIPIMKIIFNGKFPIIV